MAVGDTLAESCKDAVAGNHGDTTIAADNKLTSTVTGASDGQGTIQITYSGAATVQPGAGKWGCVWLASTSAKDKASLAKNPAVITN